MFDHSKGCTTMAGRNRHARCSRNTKLSCVQRSNEKVGISSDKVANQKLNRGFNFFAIEPSINSID